MIYYGSNPPNLEDVKNITAPVLGQYGGADERITSAVPKLADAMKNMVSPSSTKSIPARRIHSIPTRAHSSYREDAAKEA